MRLSSRIGSVFMWFVLLALVACKWKSSQSSPHMLGRTEIVTHEMNIPLSTVLLSVYGSPTQDSSFSRCTGVVVSNDLVLTAAHCVADPESGFKPPALITVRAESLGRAGLEPYKTVKVAQWKRHPDFRRLGPPDIALLRLEASLDPYAKPIALAPVQLLALSSRLLLAGYGATESNGSGGVLLSGWAEIQSRDAQSEFTIRRPTEGASPYYGDSGGPAYVNSQGLWFAAGLVSRGHPSGRATYTDLSSSEMQKWILETARELGAQSLATTGISGKETHSASPRQPELCGGCLLAELEACIKSGRKDCYPSLGCVDFSQACNQDALRICLDHGGGNACYPKWSCARICQ